LYGAEVIASARYRLKQIEVLAALVLGSRAEAVLLKDPAAITISSSTI
jgi:hypothetical protein